MNTDERELSYVKADFHLLFVFICVHLWLI